MNDSLLNESAPSKSALLEIVADAVNTRLFLPAGMFSEDAKNRWPFYLLSIVFG